MTEEEMRFRGKEIMRSMDEKEQNRNRSENMNLQEDIFGDDDLDEPQPEKYTYKNDEKVGQCTVEEIVDDDEP
jgi:hypothetical protein